MKHLVLDSWGIVAWFKNQQPTAQAVRDLLDAAERREVRLIMNIVNVGEVFYIAAKYNDLKYAERVLHMLRTRAYIESAPDELVMKAAHLKARYKISYADAFAAVTAMRAKAPLLTGDLELRDLALREKEVAIEWIGA